MQSKPVPESVPVVDIDPFSDEFLMDPFPSHKVLRDAGPVVWIPKYEVFAMARHEQVRSTLLDWETFSSAAGVGLANFNHEKPWRSPSLILEVDPPYHTRTRGALNKVLNKPALERLRAGFEQKAEDLIDEVLGKDTIDGVKELAEVFPLGVFPDSVGVSREGRENLLPFANMAFNAFGPPNELRQNSLKDVEPLMGWVMSQCSRDALTADGLGADVYRQVDEGRITESEADMLVRSLLTAGLDTTIYGITGMLYSFACFPEQWKLLRERPELKKNVFDEVVRYQSPAQTFFRTTNKAAEVAGVAIPEDQKVLLFLGAANRDPRQWENPETFDITRKAVGHVGFGAGVHMCVGQMLSKLEAGVVLDALVDKVGEIELAGEPTLRLNNTLRGLEGLPLRLHRA